MLSPYSNGSPRHVPVVKRRCITRPYRWGTSPCSSPIPGGHQPGATSRSRSNLGEAHGEPCGRIRHQLTRSHRQHPCTLSTPSGRSPKTSERKTKRSTLLRYIEGELLGCHLPKNAKNDAIIHVILWSPCFASLGIPGVVATCVATQAAKALTSRHGRTRRRRWSQWWRRHRTGKKFPAPGQLGPLLSCQPLVDSLGEPWLVGLCILQLPGWISVPQSNCSINSPALLTKATSHPGSIPRWSCLSYRQKQLSNLALPTLLQQRM